jgi:adenylate cyclase
MFTDIADSTQRMDTREELGLRVIRKHNAVMDQVIAKHQGRRVRTIGDAYMVDFASAVDAVAAAVEAQDTFARTDQADRPEEAVRVRIGIHLCDVVQENDDLLGVGVVVASRVSAASPPGGILITGEVYDNIRSVLSVEAVRLGPYELKGVSKPVEVYQVLTALVPRPVQAGGSSTESPDDLSIAVLPFTNWSALPEDEYFSDGITEDIITDLAKIHPLRVSSRNSTFAYKGKAVSVRRAGQELGVRYILEGSVRRSGSRLRVTAQLVDAARDTHLWAERFDREMADIFVIQDEIAKSIAGELRIRLTQEQTRAIETADTASVEAYDLYLKGVFLSRKRVKADLDAADQHFESSLRLDPGFARAHAALAWSLRFKFAMGMDRAPDVLERAGRHTRRALELRPELPDGLLVHALLLREEGRTSQAIEVLRQLVGANPSHAQGQAYLGNVLRDVGIYEEALARHHRAQELDPLDFYQLANIAQDLELMGRSQDAEPFAEKSARLAPDHFTTLYVRARRAFLEGEDAEGERLTDAMMHADPGNQSALGFRGMGLRWRGRDDEAYRDFRLIADRGGGQPIVFFQCLQAFAAGARYDDALGIIDRLLKESPDRWVNGYQLRSMALAYRALILSQRGDEQSARRDLREARTAFTSALREFPGSLSCRGVHAVVLAALGEADAAAAEIESVERECPSFALTALFRAVMAAASRDKAGLLRWAAAVRERGIEVPWGLRNPALFGEYASDPEYLAVVGSGSELDAARIWRKKSRPETS